MENSDGKNVDSTQCVRVAVNIQPLITSELLLGCTDCISVVPGEPQVQLARELGLQPRQVAIWFQNRRARCKSKQLERDCFILRANYNTVASKFEALKKDNHALLIQLQKLKDVMQNLQDQTYCCKKVKATNSMARGSNNGETIKCEAEVKPSSSMERSEQVLGVLSDDDSSIKAEYFGLQDDVDDDDEVDLWLVEAVGGKNKKGCVF